MGFIFFVGEHNHSSEDKGNNPKTFTYFYIAVFKYSFFAVWFFLVILSFKYSLYVVGFHYTVASK